MAGEGEVVLLESWQADDGGLHIRGRLDGRVVKRTLITNDLMRSERAYVDAVADIRAELEPRRDFIDWEAVADTSRDTIYR